MFNNTFIISPLPAPNSIKLNFLDNLNFPKKKLSKLQSFQKISIDIFGAVIKSPFYQKDFFSYNNQIFYYKETLL